MIVTVLWEDSRGTQARGFGPHELLLSCVADRTKLTRLELGRVVVARPLKGAGNVRRVLQRDLDKLRRKGRVVAVLDSDELSTSLKAAGDTCPPALKVRWMAEIPGDYQVVFIVRNTETLIEAACGASSVPRLGKKPTPDERDRILIRVAWGIPDQRRRMEVECRSFGHLVSKVAAAVTDAGPG